MSTSFRLVTVTGIARERRHRRSVAYMLRPIGYQTLIVSTGFESSSGTAPTALAGNHYPSFHRVYGRWYTLTFTGRL